MRRVYQRGCVNPMINIEQLWRDYSKYEEVRDRMRVLSVFQGILSYRCNTSVVLLQGINVHLAKKMIEDRSRDYMNARRVAKVNIPKLLTTL